MSKAHLIPEHAPLERHAVGALSTVGRHPDNTIEVHDRSVSKFHAQIQRSQEGVYSLKDMGSRNGTYVNGERVAERDIVNGDEVVFGTVRFRFRAERPSTGITPVMREMGTPPSGGGVTMLGPVPGSAPSKVSLIASEPAIQVADSFAGEQDRFLPGDQIQNADALRRDYDKLRIAHELNAALRMDLDVDEMLRAIAERSFELISADRCAILLMCEDGETLEPRMVMERGGGELKDAIRLSQTVLDQVISNRKAILCTDASADGRFESSKSILALSMRSAMCVPLLYEDELFGAMHVDSLQQARAFSQKDLKLFTSIANQTAVALKNASLMQQVQEESEQRARLGRLLSPNLVEEVVSGKLDLVQGGEMRRVAMMFTDIRGFTRMSDMMTAEQVTHMLNEYFEVMVEVLFKLGGTLDKYMGDGMMALFGVPRDDPQASLQAVRCGLEMQTALRSLNRARQARGDREISIGIGINVGEVTWGPIGSHETMDYTVIGDEVNVAARLCSMAPPGEVIISRSMFEDVGDYMRVEALEPAVLKGKPEPVPVYRVIGPAA
ncbi:MAG: adenylate cyclase [Rickettsiales bacterium]|nr:adenylate cyclase [Rickettsiales bacterium]